MKIHADKIRKIVLECMEANDGFAEDLKEIEEMKKADLITNTVAHQKRGEVQEKRKKAIGVALDLILDAKDEAYKAIRQWAMPSGDKLDLTDLELLKGHITLTADELKALGEKHADNPIMQRAFREYAEKNDIIFIKAPDDDVKRYAIDQIVLMARAAISNSQSYQGRIMADDKYFADFVDSLNAGVGAPQIIARQSAEKIDAGVVKVIENAIDKAFNN